MIVLADVLEKGSRKVRHAEKQQLGRGMIFLLEISFRSSFSIFVQGQFIISFYFPCTEITKFQLPMQTKIKSENTLPLKNASTNSQLPTIHP